MAGGDIDAGDAAVLPYSEGQLRRGAQGLEQAHGDAVARHDTGGLPGEEAGVVAAVKADGHATGGGLRSLLQDHMGKGLGGVTDHMNIHAVQTYTHSAAQTGGAEGQLVKKAGLDLLLIPADGLQFRFFLLRKGGTVQPVLIIFPIRHICKTSCV